MKIWKFPVALGTHPVAVPEGASLLSVGCAQGVANVWCACDPDAPKITRTFLGVGTGGDVPPAATFVGTVVVPEGLPFGDLVIHIYEA